MRLRNKITLLLFLVFLICMTACGKKKDVLEYSVNDNWAFMPEENIYDVDIFFIAPTSGFSESLNMDMKDADYLYAFRGATEMEKGIYDDAANFYAPFYRQVSLEYYSSDMDKNIDHLNLAYDDIEAAFEYYIKNLNNGRAFVLAGFSQGGYMVKRLMEEFKYPEDKLVASYIIGWNVTEEELNKYPKLKMAEGETDTGVIVSFCSENENITSSVIVPDKTKGINPLNWKTDSTLASKEENEGACFTNYSGVILDEIPYLCGAYIDGERGTLKVTDITPEQYPAGLGFLDEGNYHLYDYQFFYRNLEENVQKRIETYLSQAK